MSGRRRRKSRLLQLAEYGLYRLVAGIVQRASEERVKRWGSRLGSLTRRILKRRDRLAWNNLRSAFPEKTDAELRVILDECWRHFGRETLLYLYLQAKSLEEIAARCDFINLDLIERGFAAGRGLVVISAHYGAWEVAGLAVAVLQKPHLTVARPLDNQYLERNLMATRARTGAKVVDRRSAARPLMKALAENQAVVLLPDQAVLPREGVRVGFLGRPAWTTDAPAKLALRHDSTIVFAFCIPHGTRHRLEFEEAIPVDRLNERERDPVALTQRINDVISRRIAARPELWLWMHDRWKWTGESEQTDGKPPR